MYIMNTLANILDNPDFIKESSVREVTQAGWLGYFIGALSLFIFACVFNVAPHGFISFLFILFAVLVTNFLFSSMVHLSLESTGCSGNAYKLFLFFGIGELLWSFMVPLANITNFKVMGMVFDICVVSALVCLAKIFFIGRLYGINKLKASLAFFFPGLVAFIGSFILMIYGLIWIFWLII